MVTRDQIEAVVLGAISETLGAPADSLPRDEDVRNLGLDSVDVTSILLDIEEGLGVEIPIDALDEMVEDPDHITLARILDTMERWLATPAPGSPHPTSP